MHAVKALPFAHASRIVHSSAGISFSLILIFRFPCPAKSGLPNALTTHPHIPLIVIPTYNTGPKVLTVVREVVALGHPVIVVVDGSTDGTTEQLLALRAGHDHLEVLIHEKNRGKGAAVLTAARHARELGATHLLAFDADGQHPADAIAKYLQASADHPTAMVAGYPIFDANAPWERVFWRKLANFWTNFLSVQGGLKDSMFGMRVYPLLPLLKILEAGDSGQRYDFECVAAIQLGRAGVPFVNVPTPVQYFLKEEGGVTHYRYVQDNFRLAMVYLFLIPSACLGRIRKALGL